MVESVVDLHSESSATESEEDIYPIQNVLPAARW